MKDPHQMDLIAIGASMNPTVEPGGPRWVRNSLLKRETRTRLSYLRLLLYQATADETDAFTRVFGSMDEARAWLGLDWVFLTGQDVAAALAASARWVASAHRSTPWQKWVLRDEPKRCASDIRAAFQEGAETLRKAQHPLSHGKVRQHVIGDVGGDLGHSPRIA